MAACRQWQVWASDSPEFKFQLSTFLTLWYWANYLTTVMNEDKKYLSHRVVVWKTPWTAAPQAPLSSTISQSLLKFMSIELMMLSNHLILCHHFLLLPSSFPASGSFPVSWLFASSGQSFGASASASVLPMNIHGWFPLGLTGLISLECKGLSTVFSSTIQKHKKSILWCSAFFIV